MPSFGETLRRERESRQIALREVAEATKISLRYLEALESNDFRHLPGGVFNKGFVRAYAQYLGVDPERLIEAYLVEQAANQPAGSRGEAGEAQRAHRAAPGRGRWIVVGLVALTVVIALAAAAWWFWVGSGR